MVDLSGAMPVVIALGTYLVAIAVAVSLRMSPTMAVGLLSAAFGIVCAAVAAAALNRVGGLFAAIVVTACVMSVLVYAASLRAFWRGESQAPPPA